MANLVVKNGNFDKVLRRLDATQDGVQRAVAKTLTRTAANGRKTMKDEMRRRLDKPTTQTLNAVLFKAANPKSPIALQYSATFVREFASDYLKNVVSGGTETRRHGRRGVLTINAQNLRRRDVRRVLGAAVGKINRFGNLTNFQSGGLKLLTDHEATFTSAGRGDDPPAGIYVRVPFGRKKRGKPRKTRLIQVARELPSLRREVRLPFSDILLGEYRRNFAKTWRKSAVEELRRQSG